MLLSQLNNNTPIPDPNNSGKTARKYDYIGIPSNITKGYVDLLYSMHFFWLHCL